MYYQVSCGYVCKREKKSTQFVRLVLTGVRVTNFFNIADFDLIFLHNTHILSVCLFVGLFVILFCLWAFSADRKQQTELSKREKWLVPVFTIQSN